MKTEQIETPQKKNLSKGCLWLIIINVILFTTLAIVLVFYNPSPNTINNRSNPIQQPQKQVDYEQLLRENTKTLNAGEYKFEDKFKAPSYYKVKPINPKTAGNFTVYDANNNLVTNEILGDGIYGVKECITILDYDCKIVISGIDRVMFTPVVTGGKLPAYENKALVPGYHLVGHTVSAGKYTIAAKNGSGNLMVFRGNSLQANEILGGDNGISSYSIELQNNDIIYTSGVYINLSIGQ